MVGQLPTSFIKIDYRQNKQGNMKMYMKDANRTASAIANEIKQSDSWGFKENISKQAYKWLEMNANSLAHLVEDLLEEKYHIVITRGKEYGECYIQVEWHSAN